MTPPRNDPPWKPFSVVGINQCRCAVSCQLAVAHRYTRQTRSHDPMHLEGHPSLFSLCNASPPPIVTRWRTIRLVTSPHCLLPQRPLSLPAPPLPLRPRRRSLLPMSVFRSGLSRCDRVSPPPVQLSHLPPLPRPRARGRHRAESPTWCPQDQAGRSGLRMCWPPATPLRVLCGTPNAHATRRTPRPAACG